MTALQLHRLQVVSLAVAFAIVAVTNYQQGRQLDKAHRDFKTVVGQFEKLSTHFDTLHGAFEVCMGEVKP